MSSAKSSAGRSLAFLIGVSDYEDPFYDDLPGVRGNIRDLAQQFQDPAVWGISRDHCHEILNPRSPHEALEPLRATEDLEIDTLMVYYSGHGIIDNWSSELCLGLPESRPRYPETSLPYAWLRQTLMEIPAERKIVILDCCYSGRALGSMSGAQVPMADSAVVEGTYLIASAAETAQALAPAGARHTAFSGELVKLLALGVPGGPGFLRLDSVFNHLARELRAKSFPEPQVRVRNSAGRLPLFRNRAHQPCSDIGKLAERYVRGSLIHEDSLTETFQAHDVELNRSVVVKLMRPSVAEDASAVNGFHRLSKTRALLSSRVVPILLDVNSCLQDGIRRPYVVMEDFTALPGETLARQGRLRPERALQATSDVLEMLESAHELGLFGWHLEPERVLITSDEHVRLTDLDGASDGCCDVYKTAEMLYTLLTGVAFSLETDGFAIVPPSSFNPDVSDEVDAVLLKALAADRSERFVTAKAMRLAIKELLGRTHQEAATFVLKEESLSGPSNSMSDTPDVYNFLWSVIRPQPKDDLDALLVRAKSAFQVGWSGYHDQAAALLSGLVREFSRSRTHLHTSTLRVRKEHIANVRKSGDYLQAAALLDDLVPDVALVWGPHDRETLDARYNQALCVGESGNFERALTLFDNLAFEFTRTLGMDHSRTYEARVKFGEYVAKSGDQDRANSIFRGLVRDFARFG